MLGGPFLVGISILWVSLITGRFSLLFARVKIPDVDGLREGVPVDRFEIGTHATFFKATCHPIPITSKRRA